MRYTHIGERRFDLGLNLFVTAIGNADAAGLGQSLQSRGDIDAIPIYVVAIDDHVAEINADTKGDRGCPESC